MVKVVIARNRLKNMLVDNGSFVNIVLGAIYDMVIVDHELALISLPLYGFTGDNIIPK